MKFRIVRLIACATLPILFFGCAGRSLPEYEPPLSRSQFMKVRTTAYTDTESDHRRYGKSSAMGTTLGSGSVRSAAGDWARWPAGTKFLLLSTGQIYEVDDYGWALSGRNTIDLYCPSWVEMNNWGVRQVTIQILQWGDPWKSYHILKPRRDYAHVRRMLDEIRRFY
jgi:3D (Asp-Asp-Asp) domain-containing protein